MPPPRGPGLPRQRSVHRTNSTTMIGELAAAMHIAVVFLMAMTVVDAQSSTTDASTTTAPATTTIATTSQQPSAPPSTTTPAPSTTAAVATTTTAAPTPVPTTTAAPIGTPAPTNVTVVSQTIEYPVIIGGGAIIFALVIGACYVTFMWQQKALRLYKATYEEVIKDRGRARRDIVEVFAKGENRVFDYRADKEGDGEEDMISDLSPVAMRARILGQQYTAAKYVEKKQAHPFTIAPRPATYVGRGPVYHAPVQFASQRDEEESGAHLFGDDTEMSTVRPDATSAATVGALVRPQLFDGMSMRQGRVGNNNSFRSDTTPLLRAVTDDSTTSRNDDASSTSDSRRTGSHDAQRRIVEQALLVQNSIQELRGHSALRNISTSSMW